MINNSRNEPGAQKCPSCKCYGGLVGTSKTSDVWRCRKCGLNYLGDETRRQTEDENSWYEEIAGFGQSQLKYFFDAMGECYTRQLEELRKIAQGKKILDVGCGIGIFLSFAAKLGWMSYGLELSVHARNLIKREFNFQCFAHIAELDGFKFDAIRLSHVLEHVAEPQELLQGLRARLSERGVIMIIVPNAFPLFESLVNSMRRIFSKKPKLTGAIYPKMHVLGFSPTSLENVVCREGFKKKKIFCVSMGNKTYYPMWYDGLLNRTPPPFRERFSKYNLSRLLANLGNSFGYGEWIVGYFVKTDK